MFQGLRRQLARALAVARPQRHLPDASWNSTLARFRFLARLDEGNRQRLRELVTVFLDRKEFHGAGGLDVTGDMALAVAAQACLPLLCLARNRSAAQALDWYDDFVGIVLHPGEVLAQRMVLEDSGVVHHFHEALTGESMDGGPVMLSWADVDAADLTAESGYNVVIHEFAHKIDQHDGQADGCPPLPAGFLGASHPAEARRRWRERFGAEYDKFSDQVTAAARFGPLVPRPWLDAYGAESWAEFFAVACEAYFVNPEALSREHPDLHTLLDQLFRPPT